MKNKFKIKISPSIVSAISGKDSDWLIIEREIKIETTIGDLLRNIGETYKPLEKMLFNPDNGEPSDQIVLVLNHNILDNKTASIIKMNCDDTIVILPIYEGG